MKVIKIVDALKLRLFLFKQNTVYIHSISPICCGESLALFCGGKAPETKELTERQLCSIQINWTPKADFKFE